MKSKFLLSLSALLLFFSLTASADDWQHISINGVQLTKRVARIEFGDYISRLIYDDETGERVFTTTLSAVFDRTTGIGGVEMFGGVVVDGNALKASGLAAGSRVNVYDASGRMVLQGVVSQEGTLSLNAAVLKSGGVYVLKSGKTVVKFVKK